MNWIIDAHIHLDRYDEAGREQVLAQLGEQGMRGLVTVSMDLESAKANLAFAQRYRGIYPCFGYHPEQALPRAEELDRLFHWMEVQQNNMVAIGEVGLPYYLRQEEGVDDTPYYELLEQFILLAKRLEKPLVLHAVYEDAGKACDLLEKHSWPRAHFHWFKGEAKTMERMIQNGYLISVTPDLLYEEEIRNLVRLYPLSQMMVETDGPWPFAGPFQGRLTVPLMIHQTIAEIASLKREALAQVYEQLYQNTERFYLQVTTKGATGAFEDE